MKRCIAAILALLLCLCPAGLASAEREEMSASARTTLEGSSYAKLNNIELAASSLNGITVPQGATFSFNDIVGPRTAAYGYQRAANGRGARVTGGGVAKCATTLYLSLQQLDADVEKQLLYLAISKLGERERRIISLRYGLAGGREYTQKEVADMMGISQSYISRLEKRIISQLHDAMEKMA